MKTAIAKLRDGTEVEVYFVKDDTLFPVNCYGPDYLHWCWTVDGAYLEDGTKSDIDILNIDDVLHDLDIPNTSYVVKTLANTKWSELPESKLRAMYDFLTGE